MVDDVGEDGYCSTSYGLLNYLVYLYKVYMANGKLSLIQMI